MSTTTRQLEAEPVYVVQYAGVGRGYFIVCRTARRAVYDGAPVILSDGPYTTRDAAQAEADRRNRRRTLVALDPWSVKA